LQSQKQVSYNTKIFTRWKGRFSHHRRKEPTNMASDWECQLLMAGAF